MSLRKVVLSIRLWLAWGAHRYGGLRRAAAGPWRGAVVAVYVRAVFSIVAFDVDRPAAAFAF
jgi:hypothetical protein